MRRLKNIAGCAVTILFLLQTSPVTSQTPYPDSSRTLVLNTKLRLLIGDHETLKISKEQIRMMDSLLVACDREAQLQAQRIRLLERLDSARRAYIANQQVELNLRQEQAEDCKAQAHILQTALRQQKWRTAEVGGVGLVAIVYLSYLLIKK